MTQPTCEQISGQGLRPLFGQELTAESLERVILRTGQLSAGDVRLRREDDCAFLDWWQDGISYTAGLKKTALLFINLRFEPGQLSARRVIDCLGPPEWYQACADSYPHLGTSSVQAALVFHRQRCIAYGARHYSSAPTDPPVLDDSLPIPHLAIFGPDWSKDERALKMSRPWPGNWKALEIKMTVHNEIRPSTWTARPEPFDAIPIEGALSQIAQAFADAPRPPDDQLLHEDCRDDGDIRALYGVARWQDLPDASVEAEYAALFFLGPAGFRHFLPAYMSCVLRRRDSGAAVVQSTIFALTPALEGRQRAFAQSRYALLNRAQQIAVISFLEAMVGFEDVGPALDYWRAQLVGFDRFCLV